MWKLCPESFIVGGCGWGAVFVWESVQMGLLGERYTTYDKYYSNFCHSTYTCSKPGLNIREEFLHNKNGSIDLVSRAGSLPVDTNLRWMMTYWMATKASSGGFVRNTNKLGLPRHAALTAISPMARWLWTPCIHKSSMIPNVQVRSHLRQSYYSTDAKYVPIVSSRKLWSIVSNAADKSISVQTLCCRRRAIQKSFIIISFSHGLVNTQT